jgi:hypothetical protein
VEIVAWSRATGHGVAHIAGPGHVQDQARGKAMSRTAVAALVLALVATPAVGERPRRSPSEKRDLIGRCISEYGLEHSDRCVEIIDPDAAARRAYRDYHGRDRERIERERRCWEDPRIINPMACSRGADPVMRR